MQEKATDEFDKQVEKLSPKQLKEFIKDNRQYIAEGEKAFYYFMKNTYEAKNILLKDVYNIANVSPSYGGKIISMEKHTTNRNLIIRLCLAGRFQLDETNRALKLYGMNELYSKNLRDLHIIVEITNRVYDIYKIDEYLIDNGFEPLSQFGEK